MIVRSQKDAIIYCLLITCASASISTIVYGVTYRHALPAGASPDFLLCLFIAVCVALPIAILMTQSNLALHRLNTKNEALAREAEAAHHRFRDIANVASEWLWEIDGALRVVFSGGQSNPINSPLAPGGGPALIDLLKMRNTDKIALRRAFEAKTSFTRVPARIVKPGAPPVIVELSGSPVHDEGGVFKGYRGVGFDITERVAADAKIRFLANNDELTGLLNRRAFNAHLAALKPPVEGEEVAGLILADLDSFKPINDTYGHEVGDRLLRLAAARLGGCVRKSDVCFRLGGDEFAILAPSLSDGEASTRVLCERVLQAFDQPFEIDGVEHKVGVSLGVAIARPAHVRHVFDHADKALYASKAEGGQRFSFFTEEMAKTTSRRHELETELRAAIEMETLDVAYQPQVRMSDGAVVGMEALARWTHGDLGRVSPAEFIPAAERAGLMPALTRLILRRSMEHAKAWPDCPVVGAPPRLSVNVSPSLLFDKDLSDMVEREIHKRGFDGRRLELEITETLLMRNREETIENMTRLGARGVTFAVDDFGTGYSSLSYLTRFPVQRLKIDRSFVADLDSPQNMSVTRSIVQLAYSLGLETVAEGVETEAQIAHLRALGCDLAQGFCFARPMPMDEAVRYLREPAATRKAADPMRKAG